MHWIRGTLTLIAVGLLGAPVAWADSLVTLTEGSVDVRLASSATWEALEVGDRVSSGDVVRTGARSRAELVSDERTVRLFEKTLLHVGGETRDADLERGSSVFDVRKRPAGNPYRVRTPHAVVMVKGTRFTVVVDGDLAAVEVTEGLVGFTGLGSGAKELLVRPGFMAYGGPQAPFALGLLEHDSWESWELKRTPPAPSAVDEDARQARRTQLRASVLSAVDRALLSRVESPLALDAVSSSQGTTGPAPLALDRVAAAQVQQQAASLELGPLGSFSVNAQGAGGSVLLSGPGISEVLGVLQLREVAGGNTALLSPALLGILATQNVDPQTFAQQLLGLF